MGMGKGHLPSLCGFQRDSPIYVPPRSAGRWNPERLANSAQSSSPPCRTDVVWESGLFSLSCGEDYSEKIGLQLLGIQLLKFYFSPPPSHSALISEKQIPVQRCSPGPENGVASWGWALSQRRKAKAELVVWGRSGFGAWVALPPRPPSSSMLLSAAFLVDSLDRNWPYYRRILQETLPCGRDTLLVFSRSEPPAEGAGPE